MLDHMQLYDAIYLLAADDGREDALFGSCQPLAREALSRSLMGDEFPILWFELPLAGSPRFDLHVAVSRATIAPGVTFSPDAEARYADLFRWYAAEEPGGAGLAFAYNVSEGCIDAPAVHVNVNNAPLDHMDRFFDLTAGGSAAEHYQSFEARLPQGWRVWYVGHHPGRTHAPVRVDCFVGEALKAAYASVPSLLEEHLRECGFAAPSGSLRRLAGYVTNSPFGLELQFDIFEDGSVGTTMGISAGLPLGRVSQTRALFEDDGAAALLMNQVEQEGLTDGRWRLISEASFATLVDTGANKTALYNEPAFVKMRVREGEPLDAKVYLQAGAHVQRQVDSRS